MDSQSSESSTNSHSNAGARVIVVDADIENYVEKHANEEQEINITNPSYELFSSSRKPPMCSTLKTNKNRKRTIEETETVAKKTKEQALHKIHQLRSAKKSALAKPAPAKPAPKIITKQIDGTPIRNMFTDIINEVKKETARKPTLTKREKYIKLYQESFKVSRTCNKLLNSLKEGE